MNAFKARHVVLNTVEHLVDAGEHPGILIGRASHHHAVHACINKRLRLVEGGDLSIDQHHRVGKVLLEPKSSLANKRRNLSILLRRQPLEPGRARMNDEDAATSIIDRAHEVAHKAVFVVIIHPDAVLHRHGLVRHVLHRPDAGGHGLRLEHQTRPEASLLHTLGRASAVEVVFVITVS